MEPHQSVSRDEFAQLSAQMAQMMQLMQANQGTTAVITPAVPPPLPTIPTKTSLELLVDETNASTPTGLGQWEAPDVVWSVFEKLCEKGPLNFAKYDETGVYEYVLKDKEGKTVNKVPAILPVVAQIHKVPLINLKNFQITNLKLTLLFRFHQRW